MTSPAEFLNSAREAAAAGHPTSVTVRQLLEIWGSKRRGTRIATAVQRDLSAVGLATEPSFMKVSLDASVEVVAVDDKSGPGREPEDTSASLDELDPVGLTVGNIESAFGGIVSVSPNATFEEAQTKMMMNDYSQLAVMTGERSRAGAVTWESIARAKVRDANAQFSNAVIGDPQEVRFDADLFDVVGLIVSQGFVFVRDQTNRVSGIVTTSDLSEQYADLAKPFLHLGDIDQLLRRVIERTFTLDEVRTAIEDGATGGTCTSFDDLGMGDYQRVLENPERWSRLGWSLDRKVFIERLERLRGIRNDVMHFNPDPVTPEDLEDVRLFLQVLREFAA